MLGSAVSDTGGSGGHICENVSPQLRERKNLVDADLMQNLPFSNRTVPCPRKNAPPPDFGAGLFAKDGGKLDAQDRVRELHATLPKTNDSLL